MKAHKTRSEDGKTAFPYKEDPEPGTSVYHWDCILNEDPYEKPMIKEIKQ